MNSPNTTIDEKRYQKLFSKNLESDNNKKNDQIILETRNIEVYLNSDDEDKEEEIQEKENLPPKPDKISEELYQNLKEIKNKFLEQGVKCLVNFEEINNKKEGDQEFKEKEQYQSTIGSESIDNTSKSGQSKKNNLELLKVKKTQHSSESFLIESQQSFTSKAATNLLEKVNQKNKTKRKKKTIFSDSSLLRISMGKKI